MTPELRRLRYFVATVDAGSATQAARLLHVTQPVLSRQLQLLQKEIGLRLFTRDGRRFRLTHAGETYLFGVRQLLQQADRLDSSAASLASGRLQDLHLAVPATTLTDVIAPFIATLDSTDPVPMLRSLDPRGATAAIADGADLAIVHRPPPRSLASRQIAALPIWAQVPSQDPLATHESVDLKTLAERTLVLLTEDFRPRTLLNQAMESVEIAYSDFIECTNAQVAQALSAAGRGVAVVSDDTRFELVARPIAGLHGPVTLRLYAAWDRRHHAAETIAALVDRIAEFCIERYDPTTGPA
ncbi:hypothetical protein GCM10011492_09170 [Flexivirga endophytica]|uniref:HTH lysR-type domain-containing protein n=1 Tax=Flexivirga endophytica TaxID=1849103 RepID=A0A916SXY7_9MICO|nr:LysR family transcriptional regulator [Flexivirga endophytica]GGB21403.1 hypothetical protein GCM10011492_09170 [Flexivirga endophytica]GHB59069.1 hypothetical protein GCM10008112_30190 [Flexivirga endophytica]